MFYFIRQSHKKQIGSNFINYYLVSEHDTSLKRIQGVYKTFTTSIKHKPLFFLLTVMKIQRKHRQFPQVL